MKRVRAALGCLLALLGESTGLAHAQEQPAHWEVQAKLSVMNFRYEEFGDDGGVLDRETGVLPGVVAGLSRIAGPWRIHGEFSVHQGEADYSGQTTGSIPGIPVSTQTSERIVDAHARIERWNSPDGRWRAAVYAGLGYRGWNRDISPSRTGSGLYVLGATEYYETGYGMLGAKAATGPENSQWMLDLRVLHTIEPKVHVAAGSFGDALTLSLGARTSGAIALGWRTRRATGTVLGAEAFVEQWKFGRSAPAIQTRGGAPTGFVVYEPESETRSYGLRAVLTGAF
jgi:hypothetical protein